MKNKALLYIVAVVLLLYLMSGSAAAAKPKGSGGGVNVDVDTDALQAFKNGTASAGQMVMLGWPFIAEASLSFLSGPMGARVLGPMSNGPDNRAGPQLYESCLQAGTQLDPDYGTTIDGYTAKLAYMNAQCQKHGRPQIYGFENQAQPHDP